MKKPMPWEGEFIPPDLMLLSDVINEIGSKMHGEKWTGEEIKPYAGPPRGEPLKGPSDVPEGMTKVNNPDGSFELIHEEDFRKNYLEPIIQRVEDSRNRRFLVLHEIRNRLWIGEVEAVFLLSSGVRVPITSTEWEGDVGATILGKRASFYRYNLRIGHLSRKHNGRALVVRSDEGPRTDNEAKPSRAKAGSDCEEWLSEMMGTGPQVQTKSKYFKEAEGLFSGLSRRQFDSAWAKSIERNPGCGWGRPGPLKST